MPVPKNGAKLGNSIEASEEKYRLLILRVCTEQFVQLCQRSQRFMLKDIFQDLFYRLIDPAAKVLIRFGVHPNVLTMLGLLISGASAAVLIWSNAETSYPADALWISGALLLSGGILDIFDGRVARLGNTSSRAGALLDSTVDRYSEIIFYLGLGVLAWKLDDAYLILASFAALCSSMMVSYTRARTEALGHDGTVGLFQRPERIVIAGFALIAAGIFGAETGVTILNISIWTIAAGAGVTAVHRLLYGMKNLRD
jgi:CDP-diacylglycerol--glycerol-3-phosphate 3-phosphatidyltransferase